MLSLPCIKGNLVLGLFSLTQNQVQASLSLHYSHTIRDPDPPPPSQKLISIPGCCKEGLSIWNRETENQQFLLPVRQWRQPGCCQISLHQTPARRRLTETSSVQAKHRAYRCILALKSSPLLLAPTAFLSSLPCCLPHPSAWNTCPIWVRHFDFISDIFSEICCLSVFASTLKTLNQWFSDIACI